MTWLEHHRNGEKHAAAAECAARAGDMARARELYALAAEAESRALGEIDHSKTRTLGVTAVSAGSLYYKAGRFEDAEALAHRFLASPSLPPFASSQLRFLVESIWSEQAMERANVRFARGHVFVAVKGGQVVRGGAPLDLIVAKVQTVQAYCYRTVEFIRGLQHRKHGVAPTEIQETCRPWLFQAPATSYQFAVKIQEPSQAELFGGPAPNAQEVTDSFLAILRASADSPEEELPSLVPDRDYRSSFLRLTRNLAPTGKTCDRLDITAVNQERPIILLPGHRDVMARAARQLKPGPPEETEQVETIHGVLRAVHLDLDWIQVTVGEQHQRIEQVGEAQDDEIGPMVNKPVVVRIVRDSHGRCLFRDIEPVD